MSENDPSNPNNSNNQIEAPQGEDINLINNNNNNTSPYIKEISHSQGERVIQIMAFKGIINALIILLILGIIQAIIGLVLFRNFPFLKWLFILLMLPFIILFLLIPMKAICKYDYKNMKFSSYVYPIIPIQYFCLTNHVNFNEISYFYFFKVKSIGKKFYKIGISKVDGQDLDIIIGQDHVKLQEYDNNLLQIPSLLKSYLRE